MHNISISFLFLVFRDTIVANKAVKPPFSPLICNTMTFDTQRCHEIGIPRDLLLKTALKVQPFSFFFHLLHFLTVYHSVTVRNMICHYVYLI